MDTQQHYNLLSQMKWTLRSKVGSVQPRLAVSRGLELIATGLLASRIRKWTMHPVQVKKALPSFP